MSSKTKLYFKDKNDCIRDLSKFKNTYNLIAKNWESITSAYKDLNKDRKFSGIPADMACSKQRFAEVIKDLGLNPRIISIDIYYNSSSARILSLKAKEDE